MYGACLTPWIKIYQLEFLQVTFRLPLKFFVNYLREPLFPSHQESPGQCSISKGFSDHREQRRQGGRRWEAILIQLKMYPLLANRYFLKSMNPNTKSEFQNSKICQGNTCCNDDIVFSQNIGSLFNPELLSKYRIGQGNSEYYFNAGHMRCKHDVERHAYQPGTWCGKT